MFSNVFFLIGGILRGIFFYKIIVGNILDLVVVNFKKEKFKILGCNNYYGRYV